MKPKAKKKVKGKPKLPVKQRLKLYLEALSECGAVTVAAKYAEIGFFMLKYYRDRLPEFAQAEAEAKEKAHDVMYQEARRRAIIGNDTGRRAYIWVDKDGKDVLPNTKGAHRVPVAIREYSDTLLIFLMKASKPDVYRERYNVNYNFREKRELTAKAKITVNNELIEALRAVGSRSIPDLPGPTAEANGLHSGPA